MIDHFYEQYTRIIEETFHYLATASGYKVLLYKVPVNPWVQLGKYKLYAVRNSLKQQITFKNVATRSNFNVLGRELCYKVEAAFLITAVDADREIQRFQKYSDLPTTMDVFEFSPYKSEPATKSAIVDGDEDEDSGEDIVVYDEVKKALGNLNKQLGLWNYN